MRVLVTADTIGGVWTYTRELVTYLSQHGHEVALVSFGKAPNAVQAGWLRGLRGVEYFPTAFRLEWMQDSAADLKESSEYLFRLIAEKRPDLLHFNQYCYGALETDIPKVVVAHSDVVSWWRAVHGEEPYELWIDEYEDVVKRGIAGADVVVGITRWMLQRITQGYGRPKQAQVIYNGRSPSLFLNSQSKGVGALTVGRLWDAAKQSSLLAECAGTMPVMIAGETAHPEGGAFECGETDGVELAGPQTEEQMGALYARYAIYVGASRYEPFGLAPLEAALSGCVLVLNDIATFREVWGEDALYFARNDAASLNAQLGRLRNDAELRSTYAKRGQERALSRYSAARMGGEYVKLYELLASVRELVG